MSGDEKKIFVDEDWKAQVQREREEAAKKKEAEAPAAEAPAADAGDEEIFDDGGIPEASFLTLVGSLATQAMLALGVIAQPGQKEIMVDLLHAKYCIDMLAMLRDKTKGNLAGEEEAELTQALAELQHVFVARAQQIQEAEMKRAGIDLGNLRGEGV